MNRKVVYKLIDGERDYQDNKWGPARHSIEEWLIYIEDYVNETKHLLSRSRPSSETYMRAKGNLRKITALGICAMEQHDCVSRESEEERKK